MLVRSKVSALLMGVVLVGAGCFPTSGPSAGPRDAAFGNAVSLAIGGSANYPDGLSVTLTAIDDSRCPADVECIWQGELSPALSVKGGDAGAAQEVRLGTETRVSVAFKGYQFTLEDASTTSISLTVDKPGAVAYKDMLRVTAPQPDALVTSPMMITGEARGNWYFEASFPAKLLDADGKVLAQMPVQAQGEWMTTEFVPFSALMTFDAPTTATGTLVLEKDNPSGLPQFDDAFRIPVRFR